MPPLRPLLYSSRIRLQLNPPLRYLSHTSNVRYVKVKRPWLRGFLVKWLCCGAAAYIWSKFVLGPRLDIMSEHTEADNQQILIEERRRSTKSSTTFIPLGFPQLHEGELYAPSDPEQQTFIKIKEDPHKRKALADELKLLVLNDLSRPGTFSLQELGYPLTIPQHWLLLSLPQRAPPVYFRSGLEITETGLSWTSRPMSEEGSDRLYRCIRPLYMIPAAQDAWRVLWRRFLSKFNAESSGGTRTLGMLDSSREMLMSSDLKTLDKLGNTSQSEPHLMKSPGSRSKPGQNDEASGFFPSITLSALLERLPQPSFDPGSDLSAASLAFNRRLRQCQRRGPRISRRGTFTIKGHVIVAGSLGAWSLDIEGEYDPATSLWQYILVDVKDGGRFVKVPGGK
ncbi:hypothetical protein BJX99DRAFT_239499 [Aspergillus californicus]